MAVLQLLLNLYFAVALGVAGLAKVEQPSLFAKSLQEHRIFPQWSIPFVRSIVPWLEIGLAVALVIGLLPILMVSFVLVLFLCFFILEVTLLITGRDATCGCYGKASEQRVDIASLLTSIAFLAIATLQFLVVSTVTPLNWEWRLPTASLCIGIGCWLGWRTLLRRKALRRAPVPDPSTVTTTYTTFDYTT